MTTSSETSVLSQACALRTALEGLEAALAGVDPLAVLAAEPRLAAALAAPVVAGPVPDANRHAVASELKRAGHALARCRTTGAALADLTSATLMAIGRDGSYGRMGGHADHGDLRGRGLKARM